MLNKVKIPDKISIIKIIMKMMIHFKNYQYHHKAHHKLAPNNKIHLQKMKISNQKDQKYLKIKNK
jgi:hypothetical protein